MSVTITINNNEQYLRANNPEVITREYLDPKDPYDAMAIQEGWYPNGYRESFPFEMNLANGNFRDLFSTLGLIMADEECLCGRAYAETILGALKKFKPNNLVSEGYEDNIICFVGRSLEQVTNYYWRLMQICKEAEKRNEMVIWC